MRNPQIEKLAPYVCASPFHRQAFKYGQAVLIKRENGADDRVAKASAASACYRAALIFLEGVGSSSGHDSGRGEPSQKSALVRDASELRGKCLIQHALALHLCGHHDDALRCLDQVASHELRRDSQDLRFGVLIAVRVFMLLFWFLDPPLISCSSLAPSLSSLVLSLLSLLSLSLGSLSLSVLSSLARLSLLFKFKRDAHFIRT